MSLTAVVLAGGESSRFWPLREKPLLKFCGKTLVENQVGMLKQSGLSSIIVITNPANNAFISKIPGVKTVLQKQPRGMGDALLAAQSLLKGAIYVIKTSDLFDASLHKKMLSCFKKGGADSFLAGYRVKSYFPGGYLVCKGSQIVGVKEKPGEGREPSDLVNIVAHIHSDAEDLIKHIQAEYEKPVSTDDHYERAMDALMKKKRFEVVVYDGEWMAIKYPWDVLDAADFFMKRAARTVSKKSIIAKSAVVENSTIEEGARVFENAVVKDSFIGKNSVVGNNCLVRSSMIGDNCVVGFSTEIARSYVSDDCWFHSNYVGDSVFDKNVSLGSGAVIANLRLDEGQIFSQVKAERVATKRNKLGVMCGEGVRIGVNASIMPGVKIGTNSFVSAGITLSSDVDDANFCASEKNVFCKANLRSVRPESRQEFRKKLYANNAKKTPK